MSLYLDEDLYVLPVEPVQRLSESKSNDQEAQYTLIYCKIIITSYDVDVDGGIGPLCRSRLRWKTKGRGDLFVRIRGLAKSPLARKVSPRRSLVGFKWLGRLEWLVIDGG